MGLCGAAAKPGSIRRPCSNMPARNRLRSRKASHPVATNPPATANGTSASLGVRVPRSAPTLRRRSSVDTIAAPPMPPPTTNGKAARTRSGHGIRLGPRAANPARVAAVVLAATGSLVTAGSGRTVRFLAQQTPVSPNRAPRSPASPSPNRRGSCRAQLQLDSSLPSSCAMRR